MSCPTWEHPIQKEVKRSKKFAVEWIDNRKGYDSYYLDPQISYDKCMVNFMENRKADLTTEMQSLREFIKREIFNLQAISMKPFKTAQQKMKGS